MNGVIPIDEMVNGQGGVRPQWRRLLSAISDLGHQELLARQQQMALALADQTGALSSSSSSGAREALESHGGSGFIGAQCDPIPLLLKADEFSRLEAGIIQRARLQEALLRDIYGERSVLADHLLPPALVWANKGFLRCGEVDSLRPAEHYFISSYAVDLVREPDGQWRVLADRVRQANGLGLALENRRQMTRAIPELFAGEALQRLRSFLERWQDSVQKTGMGETANPALLTPGPSSPFWSEHVILARELGCTLVEAGDLTVREGALWLKTVRGLRKIDALLLRQNADSIDPLELEGTGSAGVSGLLDAARNGSVRLINDPRAGFVEALGVQSFLPGIASRLFGETLSLENVESLWLGQPDNRVFLEQLLFGRSQPHQDTIDYWAIASAIGEDLPAQRLATLDEKQRMLLWEKVRTEPWRYIACREPLASLSPCVGDREIVPRSIVLRMFAIQDENGWSVLPGGMCRVFESGEAITAGPIGENQPTKDVWVMVDENFSLQETSFSTPYPLAIRRSQGDLPSRAADDFFWLGRYLEQIESGARLLRVVMTHMSGTEPSPRELADIAVLMRQMRTMGLVQEAPVPAYGYAGMVRGLFAIGGSDGFFARVLRKIIRLVPELVDRLTQDVRDFISHRGSAILKMIDQRPRRTDPARMLDQLSGLTNDLLLYSATLSGFAAESMVLSGGRQFLDLGRRIERASSVLLICSGVLEQPDVYQRGRMEAALRLMLQLCDSVITYRSRYFGVVQPAPVLDLLLLDEDNPRGAAYQLAALRDSLAGLASDSPSMPEGQRSASYELADTAENIRITLAEMVASVVSASSQDTATAALPSALKDIQAAVLQLSEQIGRSYFSVLNSPRLVGIGNETAIDMDGAVT
ncbi:circularly permuted type 2 ATP-grasp protein [Acetobacter sicerae]|uniref:Circularly permuted type 2 ATP-grasp protein n=1 Tax=Acetobacter sicerae TaxID=85325 RepID=A0ABS8W0N3_9PROT|nr:circularly permuted type 2 ATP-grasp protein [Acetobacter sicerae]MCE0745115.1 circularly permuted type 2 ATP-grasp protein [Acetobacter sicerae]